MKLLSFDTDRWSKPRRPGRLVTPLERSASSEVVAPLRPFSPLPPRSGEENVVPFKRRDPMRRRRRHPLWRWLKPLALALGIVGSPVALVVWLMTSPRLAFQETVITTGDRVSQRWLEAALEPYQGRNLLRLPLGALQRRLSDGHPWIAGVDLRKSLPGRLEVVVVERQAVAVLHRGGELFYLDGKGRVIAPFNVSYGMAAEDEDGYVLISLSETEATTPSAELFVEDLDEAAADKGARAAIALYREIQGVRPSWFPGLSEIRVLGDEDFEVFSTDLPFSLLVRAGTVEYKARRFEELRSQIVERYGAPRAVDLRFARRIIVQPYDRSVASTNASTTERRS
jgi:cell division septal protein FtsQ